MWKQHEELLSRESITNLTLTPPLLPVLHFLLRASGVVHLGLILLSFQYPRLARPLTPVSLELVGRKHGSATSPIARRAADAGMPIYDHGIFDE